MASPLTPGDDSKKRKDSPASHKRSRLSSSSSRLPNSDDELRALAFAQHTPGDFAADEALAKTTLGHFERHLEQHVVALASLTDARKEYNDALQVCFCAHAATLSPSLSLSLSPQPAHFPRFSFLFWSRLPLCSQYSNPNKLSCTKPFPFSFLSFILHHTTPGGERGCQQTRRSLRRQAAFHRARPFSGACGGTR